MRYIFGLIQGVLALPVLLMGGYLLVMYPWHHLFLFGFSFAVFVVIAAGLFFAERFKWFFSKDTKTL